VTQYPTFRPLVAAATLTAALLLGANGCAQVGTAPDQPAAIELPPFPFPAVVVGDSLRNEDGIVMPIRAIVRNTAGEIIEGANIRYLYADFNRDTAFVVDSITGTVVARKQVASGRIAARVGNSLQVLRPLIATLRPDTAIAGTPPAALVTVLPDTGRSRAELNRTGDIPVTVRNLEGTGGNVSGWLVRFQLVYPANPTNDTTAAAYLVDDQLRASVLDTTDASGLAARRVRVRADRFPVADGTNRVEDSVVVQATIRYLGRQVPGSPVRLVAPVVRAGAGPTPP
jgi:hypothetical protein